MKDFIRYTLALLALAITLAQAVFAEEGSPPPPPVPDDLPSMPANAGPPGSQPVGNLLNSRSKALDFDNDVIEGMNKNPLDSLTRLGKNDDKQQGHLYHRKPHFKREIRQSVQEMGYTQ